MKGPRIVRRLEHALGAREILGRGMRDPASTKASQAALFRVYRDAVLIVIPLIIGIGVFLQHWVLLVGVAALAYAAIIRSYWYDVYNKNHRQVSCPMEECPDALAKVN